ncbi:hypothetical protein D3C81_1129440 [compost metagenome]
MQCAGRDFRTGAQHPGNRRFSTLLVTDVVQYLCGLRVEGLAFANRHEQGLFVQVATGIELQGHTVGVWTLQVDLFYQPLYHPIFEEGAAILDPHRVALS